eukprot:GFUD01043309.1.p1 GENE.GFUD01043309.1~~GFUD01043309.1.p1  ORF type:complete len:262 (-),score=67.77 GFUD01043309.1:321-1106(-)
MPSNSMCPRFLFGSCPLSAMACGFSHSKENAPLCRMWQKGFCIGATGNACNMRHYYNDVDGAIMQAARQSQRPGSNCTNQIEKYSSPYRVKVVKEVAKQRKEEVDLETGKRRSWVETTEFEVMDLTGETPVKKTRSSLNKSPLKEVNKEIERPQKSPEREETSEVSSVDPGTCPMCGRQFKGLKGVNSHRRARNSACHPDKENTTRQPPVVTPAVVTPLTRRNVDTTTPTQDRQDDSIIVIPDTPVPGNRRVSLRRSIRMV